MGSFDEGPQLNQQLSRLFATGSGLLSQEDFYQCQLRHVKGMHQHQRLRVELRCPMTGLSDPALPKGQIRLKRVRQKE